MKQRQEDEKALAAAATLYDEATNFDRGAPHEVVSGSTPVTIRLPDQLVSILKEFARREGTGYQTLLKRWLDDRVRQELDLLSGTEDPLVAAEKAAEAVLARLRAMKPGASVRPPVSATPAGKKPRGRSGLRRAAR